MMSHVDNQRTSAPFTHKKRQEPHAQPEVEHSQPGLAAIKRNTGQ